MIAPAAQQDASARLVADAALFAAHVHAGQIRTGNREPYINHPAEVAAMVAGTDSYDPVLCAAAWLHDTLEETDTTEAGLRDRFGAAVTALVVDVTDPPGQKGKLRRRQQVDHTAASGRPVKLLKIADKTSNVEELTGMDQRRFKPASAARYLKWARRVVDVCRGSDAVLEARFERSATRLQEAIEAARTIRRTKSNSRRKPVKNKGKD